MRWPNTTSTPSSDDHPPKKANQWTDPSTWTWPNPRDPGTLLPSVIFTLTTLSALRIYKSYFRRIPSVNHIKPSYFRRKSLFGYVTSVGDADNFRLFHTPGGRLAGWGWLPWKMVPTGKGKGAGLVGQTIPIRLAGIDAPELAHWGREAQPHSREALDFLTAAILHRRVRARIFRRDQYDRVVAQVFVRRRFLRRDVGLEMLKAGLATVYDAKTGSEFGNFEAKYRAAEKRAREEGKGMWSKPGLLGRLMGVKEEALESPREYKNRHKLAEADATTTPPMTGDKKKIRPMKTK